MHRKSKNYADLQIQLRKIIVMMKEQNRNPLLLSEYSHRQTEASKRMYSMKSQPTSIQNSIKESPLSRARDSNNKKTVIDFDIT